METQQKQTPQLNSFNITSQYFVQQLDALIIQLVKTFSIEYSVKPDPDAKEMVRQLLLSKAHALMSEQSEEFAHTYIELIKTNIKNGSEKISNRQAYEFIKLVGLDNVSN